MTPCPTPLPADLPALVAELTASPSLVGASFVPAHVDVFRARVLGDADRLVVLRAPGRTAVALLHDGCPAWREAATGDTLLSVSIVPDVWGEGDTLEVRRRTPAAGGAAPSVDLRYLADVDGTLGEVFALHRDAAFSVHFAAAPDGEVVLGVVDPGPAAIALYHRAGSRFVPLSAVAPPAPGTPPAPASGPVPPSSSRPTRAASHTHCDDLVYGPPAQLDAPEAPRGEDGSDVTDVYTFTTDRWRMNLSDAPDLDVLLQVRAQGPAGPRESWLFRPVGPEVWCRTGPALQGADSDEDAVVFHSEAPRFAPVPGVLPGREVLQAEDEAYGAGAASWEQAGMTLWAVVGGELRPILNVQTHAYGGYGGGGGTTTGTWAIVPTTPGLPAAVAVAYDVDQADNTRCGLGSLTVLRFDGESYVPWYSPLLSTERDYAPDERAGCRTSTWPTAW